MRMVLELDYFYILSWSWADELQHSWDIE